MAQMKQKIQTGMDKLGDMLNGNKPLLATAGANGMKTGAKKESDSLVRMSTNKSGGSEKDVKLEKGKYYLLSISFSFGEAF